MASLALVDLQADIVVRRLFHITCETCGASWDEYLSDIWNVNAMECFWCHHLAAVKEWQFRGDSNYRGPETETDRTYQAKEESIG